METVAVIGLGAMGSRIATRLLDVGYPVTVWNRSPGRLEPLLERGATPAATPREAAERSRTVITMVSDLDALRSVCEGPDGIAAGRHSGLVVVEMSTVGPAGVAALASLLRSESHVVDAPVIGSIGEAEAGTLTIFVGAQRDDLERVRSVLDTLGTVVHVGPLGAGAAAKLVANAALLGTLTALGETLALAAGLGLSPRVVADVLGATPLAEQMRRRFPLIEDGMYPRRFGLSLARKDADLILESFTKAGLSLPALAAAQTWLAAAEADGHGNRDYTAVLATMLAPRLRNRLDTPKSSDYDGLIIDLDGVVWLAGVPIDGVAEALSRVRAKGVKTLFLTNDPAHSRETQAERLAAMGIPATADDVLTASAAAAAFLANQERFAGGRVLVLGSQALRDEFAAESFELVSPPDAETAQLVIVGGHDRFDYAELCAATRAVDSGAALFATGRDPFVPTPTGREPGTGAIVAAIEAATGTSATVTGKPEPHMFETARNLLGGCENVGVVGDNLDSDIAGAQRAGFDAILVLSGATSAEDLAEADVHADRVLPSLANLMDSEWFK